MNSETQNNLILLKSMIQKQGIKKYEVAQLDQILENLFKAKILITITQDNNIIYSQDGAILRMQSSFIVMQVNKIKALLKILNYQQIRNRSTIYIAESWQVDSGLEERSTQSSRWVQKIFGNILYYENGFKQGIWGDLIMNYWSQAQVYEIGEYCKDKKYGEWIYIYENQQICGGSYNEEGQKNGKWNELSDGFMNESQVIYNGEYKNGKKIGIWNILYRWNINQSFKNIGGGTYDKISSIKVGKWTELSDNLCNRSLVVYHGQYKIGQKVGRWDIYYAGDQIGSGLYDEVNGGIKKGRWVELSDGFWRDSKVTYQGEYKNGKKVGRWDVLFKGNDLNSKNEKLGGGQYDEKDSVKFGSWIELSEWFNRNSKIIYNGEYKNDKKIGQWNIQYRDANNEQFQLIGGGKYDEMGDGIKIGGWIEISDEFQDDSKVTYKGEYKNGKKVGRWDSYWKGYGNKKFAGGSYDEKSNKVGRWIELSDGFGPAQQVIYNGEYKNGKKVGRWDIQHREKGMEQFQQIGAGLYDEGGDGIKIGRQIELWEKFDDKSQVYYNGEYKNGRKVGRWDIYFRDVWKFQQIGGGSYDDDGYGIKIGIWIQLSEGFKNSNQILYNGEYKNGKKIGTWVQVDLRKIKQHSDMKYDN